MIINRVIFSEISACFWTLLQKMNMDRIDLMKKIVDKNLGDFRFWI